ncbi:uncharacterized protein DNG_08053 [Cephalotrichum gorgonifer]|uniref:Zn(2)-C6 fungal-type domain-containing protein n=1 Tax=Cephalotrichum gorgonifer TaxID=2041049 RepID=A0AAE8N2S0_9PEZI|nr:uncharacterized protein DNG_08053 [Cephalotrichum gorgonifer]
MRRQSCDRCHGQKLRCTRLVADSAGACSRCIRQGARCVYSFSLPKGRRSRYCSVGEAGSSVSGSGSDSSSGSPNDSLAEWDRGPFIGPSNALTPTASNTSTSADGSGASPPISNTAGSNDENSPLWNSVASDWPGSGGMSLAATDGSEDHSGVFSSIHSQIYIGTGVSNAVEDDILSWDTPTGSNRGSDGRLFADNSSTRPCSLGRNIVPPVSDEKAISGDIIMRLSQLSSRLHSLLSSSCFLAETEGSIRPAGGLILDDSAFKPVAAWLDHVSTDTDRPWTDTQPPPPTDMFGLGGVMQDVFTASRQLLEVLHCQRVHSGSIQACLTASQSPSGAHGIAMTEQGATAGINSQFSGSIVRHLVMACHGLLLNVYVVVLIALQVDADLLLAAKEASAPLSDPTSGHSPPPPLADIRIVSVVHLCLYLVERQRIAVTSYLSPLNGSIFPQSTSQHARDIIERTSEGPPCPGPCHSPSPSASTYQGEEMTRQLEMEVHRRLLRLRLALRI